MSLWHWHAARNDGTLGALALADLTQDVVCH